MLKFGYINNMSVCRILSANGFKAELWSSVQFNYSGVIHPNKDQHSVLNVTFMNQWQLSATASNIWYLPLTSSGKRGDVNSGWIDHALTACKSSASWYLLLGDHGVRSERSAKFGESLQIRREGCLFTSTTNYLARFGDIFPRYVRDPSGSLQFSSNRIPKYYTVLFTSTGTTCRDFQLASLASLAYYVVVGDPRPRFSLPDLDMNGRSRRPLEFQRTPAPWHRTNV